MIPVCGKIKSPVWDSSCGEVWYKVQCEVQHIKWSVRLDISSTGGSVQVEEYPVAPLSSLESVVVPVRPYCSLSSDWLEKVWGGRSLVMSQSYAGPRSAWQCTLPGTVTRIFIILTRPNTRSTDNSFCTLNITLHSSLLWRTGNKSVDCRDLKDFAAFLSGWVSCLPSSW